MLQSRERVGTLDREITIIQRVISTGTSNEDKITSWEEIDTDSNINARKIEEGGGTSVTADRVTHSKQTSWIIRYRDDLTVQMRIVWDTKVYEILNIAESDEGRKRYMNVLTQLLDNEYFT